jgi:hypothetical protein
MNKFNTSGRNVKGDPIARLDLKSLRKNQVPDVEKLAVEAYSGTLGNHQLDFHGFTVDAISESALRFFMINHRPSVDVSGRLLDSQKSGANSTIEVFKLERDSSTLVHITTIASAAIDTPNNLATTKDGGILVTNDHSAKVGMVSVLEMRWIDLRLKSIAPKLRSLTWWRKCCLLR